LNLSKEFSTVQLILDSAAETCGVDAFALSLIKSEKQMRRLVTHLVYQSPAFGISDRAALRGALESSRHVYFDGLERGFDALYPRSVRDLIGNDYHQLSEQLCKARTYRNKIFHGQLTADSLTRQQLIDFASGIRRWCEKLSDGCHNEFSYDGFSNSLRKSKVASLDKRLQVQLSSVRDYRHFIKMYMERGRQPKKCADQNP
jgi:hypothetical protein